MDKKRNWFNSKTRFYSIYKRFAKNSIWKNNEKNPKEDFCKRT